MPRHQRHYRKAETLIRALGDERMNMARSYYCSYFHLKGEPRRPNDSGWSIWKKWTLATDFEYFDSCADLVLIYLRRGYATEALNGESEFLNDRALQGPRAEHGIFSHS